MVSTFALAVTGTLLCIVFTVVLFARKFYPRSSRPAAADTYLQTIRERCRQLFAADFEVDDALRFVRERITDTGSNIHHVATEITFMQEAANRALAAIEAEVKRYDQNLKLLLQEYDKKHLDRAAAAVSSGREAPHVEPLVYSNADTLRGAVGGMADVEYRAGYDVELTQYWRRYGGREEASRYEQLWEWVQRRRMPSMD